MRRIFLVLLTCFFLAYGEFALAEENNPHFFRKFGKPENFFQKIEPIEFHVYFYDYEDFQTLFEKIEKSAKGLFGKKLELSFFLNNDFAKKIFSLGRVERVRIEIEIVFKDENK